VTLPPGRLRLAISPALTGSPPVTKRIGIDVVAALAASALMVCRTMSQSPRHCVALGRPPVLAAGRSDPPPNDIRAQPSGPRHSRLGRARAWTHRAEASPPPACREGERRPAAPPAAARALRLAMRPLLQQFPR